MSIRRVTVLVVVASAALAACGGGGDADPFGAASTTEPTVGAATTTEPTAPVEEAPVAETTWSDVRSADPSAPTIAGDLVVYGDAAGNLTAQRPGGTVEWTVPVMAGGVPLVDLWSPTVAGDRVITVGHPERDLLDPVLVAVDLRSGEQLWSSEVPSAAVPRRVQVDQGVVVVPADRTGRRSLHAFRVDDGTPLWSTGSGHADDLGPVGGQVHATGGRVFATAHEEIVALDVATGDLLWRRPDESLATRPIVSDGELLIQTSTDFDPERIDVTGVNRTLRSVDPATGEQRWEAAAGDDLGPVGVALIDDTALLVSSKGLVAVRTDGSGEIRWRQPVESFNPAQFTSDPVVTGSTFVVAGTWGGGDEPGFVLGYDVDGTERFTWSSPAVPAGVAATSADELTVSLAASNGPPSLSVIQIPETQAETGDESVLLTLPTPGEAMTAKNAGLAALLLLVLLVLVVVPTTLFDYALEARLDQFRARLPWNRRRRAPRQSPVTFWLRWRGLVIYSLLGAFVYSLLQTDWGLNAPTIVTGAAFWASLLVLVVLEIAAIWLYQAVKYGPASIEPHVEYGTLGIAALCVAGSRAVAFVPGYVYGVVPDYRPSADFDEGDEAFTELLYAAFVLMASVGAWFAMAALGGAVDGSRWSELPAALSAGVFMTGVETLLVGLLPLRLLPGHIIRRHHPRSWKLLWGAAAFLFCLVLLHPGLVGASGRSTMWILAASAVYGGAAVTFWARSARAIGPGDVDASPATDPDRELLSAITSEGSAEP